MTEAEDRSGWVKRPTAAIKGTGCTLEDYQALYARSIEDSDTFWAGQADRLDWIKDPTVIANWSYDPVSIKWFEDGVLNICHNAVDRHVAADHGASTALIFEPAAMDTCPTCSQSSSTTRANTGTRTAPPWHCREYLSF